MKIRIYCIIVALGILCLRPAISFAQEWSEDEFAKANTAKDIPYLTNEEKQMVLYINLARLYPQKFLQIEILPYQYPDGYSKLDKTSIYYKSLVEHLEKQVPLQALVFELEMFYTAECWAEEMGILGVEGHDRKQCRSCNCRECCSYGFYTGRDIIISLLIDDGVPGYGHRLNLLNIEITTVGVSIRPHKKFKVGAVVNSDDRSLLPEPRFY